MKRHIERHANIKRYVCEICGITFRALATLKEHALFVHSENRDFACDICQKGFKNKSGLQRHLRIHSELRPYKCHCSRDYKRLSHLKRHMAAAHCMTIRKSSDAKSLEICKIETNKGAAKSKSISQKISKADRNSTFTDEIISLNMPNTAFLSEELFETTFDKNIIVDPLSAGNVENNNGYIYVPTEGIENFIEKNNRDIAADIVSKSPLMPISQSTTVSITQDSVSLDDPELNLSPNYFAFNLSSSPLGPLENITSNLQLQNQNDTPSAQDNINRPRSLPNLSSHSSNVDSLLSFSLSNNELASTFLLDNDLPPSLDHNNPSKQLFGDSNDILSMSTFTTNGDSSILDCTSENFFNISRNSEIWDIPRDSEITSALDGEVASDSCDKISCMSNFPSNSPLPGNLVFNDSLLNYAIDANAFSAEDFAMT